MINRHTCADCALKHLASAAVIAREIQNGHDTPQYRLFLLGNLNEAQEQLAGIDPGMAGLIRTLRHQFCPEGLTPAITPHNLARLEECAGAVEWRRRHGVYRGEPDETARRMIRRPPVSRNSRCRCRDKAPIDIVIPLRRLGSGSGNDELRFALRSIERHLTGYRDIIIVSEQPPPGFVNCRFLRCPDALPHKQMNIHRAIVAALSIPGIADEVIFWADDNVLLTDLAASDLPVVERGGSLLRFDGSPGSRIWHRSLRQTGEMLKQAGYGTLDFEAHTPVRFNRSRYLALESEFDFETGVGPCYISLYLNRWRIAPQRRQPEVKATFETAEPDLSRLSGKLFAGYNNQAIAGGLLRHFAERFPTPSRYEAAPSPVPLYSPHPTAGVVIGTCGSASFIELQLAGPGREPDLPVLVVDDASGDPELETVCRNYGAELLRLPEHHGHWSGDLQIFAAGLEWARRNNFELLFKFSRRFIPLRPWFARASELARTSDMPTLSSYTTSYGYGFRTECVGMQVAAWSPETPRLRDVARPGKRIFVEKYLHETARDLAERFRTARSEAYRTANPPSPDRQGYALWTDLAGTDRRQRNPGVLWHNANSPEEYAAAARAAGLDRRTTDFMF